MKKTTQQFSLTVSLIILGIVEAISGFVLWFALPTGGGQGRRVIEPTFWALSRHNWVDIHDWAAVALTAIVIIHLAIHWKWVIRMLKMALSNLNPRRVKAQAG